MEVSVSSIDWENINSKITDHFTVEDALWLHKWNRLANEFDGLTDELYADLIDTFNMAEDVRDLLDSPMKITSGFRPPTYSILVGGNDHDPHTRALAIDFIPLILSTDQAKGLLLPKLDSLEIRMENNGRGSSYIHVDRSPVVHNRFFLP
jgi:hypothetical protein